MLVVDFELVLEVICATWMEYGKRWDVELRFDVHLPCCHLLGGFVAGHVGQGVHKSSAGTE